MEESVKLIIENISKQMDKLEPTAIEGFTQLVARERILAGGMAVFSLTVLILAIIMITRIFKDEIKENKFDSDVIGFFLFLLLTFITGPTIVFIYNLSNALYPLAALLKG